MDTISAVAIALAGYGWGLYFAVGAVFVGSALLGDWLKNRNRKKVSHG